MQFNLISLLYQSSVQRSFCEYLMILSHLTVTGESSSNYCIYGLFLLDNIPYGDYDKRVIKFDKKVIHIFYFYRKPCIVRLLMAKHKLAIRKWFLYPYFQWNSTQMCYKQKNTSCDSQCYVPLWFRSKKDFFKIILTIFFHSTKLFSSK